MKKILIINNNLNIGGIQKSLINLLKVISNNYEVTLLLFSKTGELLKDVPNNVNVIYPNRIYKILGESKNELKKSPILFMSKALFMAITKFIGKRNTLKILGLFQKKYKDYDVVISYSHLTSYNSLENGCAEFVLDKTSCQNKICFIHCDYQKSGYLSEKNNKVYNEFDKIACCSESVKNIFIKYSNCDANRVFVLRNFYDLDIIKLAKNNPYIYDDKYINLITVARLSPEKGINDFIEALHYSNRNDIKYYIIGDGPSRFELEQLISTLKMKDCVYFIGEELNPYKYMKNADYFVLPSKHEAAPMVFDESTILGLPIISSETLSAKEMVEDGYVTNDFIELIKKITKPDKKNINKKINNFIRIKQFEMLLGGKNESN